MKSAPCTPKLITCKKGLKSLRSKQTNLFELQIFFITSVAQYFFLLKDNFIKSKIITN